MARSEDDRQEALDALALGWAGAAQGRSITVTRMDLPLAGGGEPTYRVECEGTTLDFVGIADLVDAVSGVYF